MTTNISFYRAMLSDVHHLVSCQQACIYQYHEQTQELSVIAQWPAKGPASGCQKNPCGKHAVQQANLHLHDMHATTAWAALHRHPILRTPPQDTRQEARQPVASPSLAEDMGTMSVSFSMAELASPIGTGNTLYGVLLLKRAQPFTREELHIVRRISHEAAMTLKNAELVQQADTYRAQLQAVLEASADSMALLDHQTRLVEVNPALARLFGVEADTLIGQECMQLFGEDDPSDQHSLDQLREALEHRHTLPYTELDLPIHGTLHAVSLQITPINTVTQQTYTLLVIRDRTAERDVQRMQTGFLSMVTHELRSPLNAINGYLDLALAGAAGDLDGSLREFLQRARAGSEHLYAMLENLFVIARVDAGQLRMKRTITSLPEIIADAVEEQEVTASDQEIHVTTNLEENIPRLYADAGRVQQVLRNLLSNALRFTPAGGQVTISAQTETQGYDAELHETMRVIKLQVNDTGIGIAPEYQERIFERFYQIPRNSTVASPGGQGLGLTIVKMIIELHGGNVRVESIPGQGSTFTCTLPCLQS